jgi:hypothetical protein
MMPRMAKAGLPHIPRTLPLPSYPLTTRKKLFCPYL